MDLSKLIGIAVFLGYIPYILSKRYTQVRKSYLLYILYLFPFIDLFITPVQYGGFSSFDGISFLTLLIIFSKFKYSLRTNGIYILLFLTFFIVLFLGSLNSEFFIESLFPYLKAILLFFFAKCLLEEINFDPDFGLELLKRLKLLALISIGFLVMQLIIGLGFTFYAALNTNTNTGAESTFRYPSFFHDAQKYAQYLAMSSFLFFIDTDRTKVRSNIYKLTLFLLMVIGLILSGGRAGFLGMCCGLAFLFLTGRNKYRMLGLLGIFIASFLVITFANKIPLLNRSETVDESYEIRNRYWQQALNIYEDNTILGIGIGNYRNYVAAYSPDQFWLLENGEILFFDHPESGYLKFLTEFGLIGFCICMLFFIIPIGSFVIEYIKTKCYTPFFLIASIISFLVSFITVYTLSDYRIAVLLIAVICVLIKSRNVFEDIC